MANVQLENGYIRIAFDLFNQLFLREFTLKQIRIILLIIRLSYGFDKKEAVIVPKSRFDCAGLHKQDINSELVRLIDANVIKVVRKNAYKINKNFDNWQIPFNKKYDEEKLKKLFSSQFGKQNTYSEVSETLTKNEKKCVNHLLSQAINTDTENNTDTCTDISTDINTNISTDIFIQKEKGKIINDPYHSPDILYFLSEFKKQTKLPTALKPQKRIVLMNTLNDLFIQGYELKELTATLCKNFNAIDFKIKNFTPSIDWLLKDDAEQFYATLNGQYNEKKSEFDKYAEAKGVDEYGN